MSQRIGLLECDHVGRRFRALAGDYSDMFGSLFARFAPEVDLVPFDVVAGEFPSGAEACEGYVCTGSRYSAYDDLPWIHQLLGFVREVHDAAVPFVGICFGHQVLAQALGGQVAKAPGGWGAGAHRVEVSRVEPWMEPRRTGARLLFMHQDQVVELPPGATVLGSADHCPVAMFEVGPAMLGIQPHPEFTPAYAEALLRDRTELIGADESTSALASLGGPTDEAAVTSWMARFLAGAGAAASAPVESLAPPRP